MYMYLWLKLHGSVTVNMNIKVTVYVLIPSKMPTFETHYEKTLLLPTPKPRHRSDAHNRTIDQCLCFRYIDTTMVQPHIIELSSL